MINCWVCLEDDYVFAEWRFIVPFKSEQLIFKFIKDAFLIAFGDELLCLYNENIEGNSEVVLNYYLECLKRIKDKTGYNLLFNCSEVNNRLNECFKLFFNIFVFDENGDIVRKSTNCMGKILIDINPKETTQKGYTEDTTPFVLFSAPVNLSKNDVAEVSVRLKTNIYFPRIPNILFESKRFYPYNNYIDNTELSQLNSDLFNSWFRSFVSLIINEYGGIVEKVFPYSFMKNYAAYISPNGINI